MKKTSKTLLAFDETQQKDIEAIKRSLSVDQKKEISNAEFFKIAFSVGFSAGLRNENMKRGNNGARLEYFKDEDWALFSAVQIHVTNEVSELLDIDGTLALAEEFAAGGVGIMSEALKSQHDLRMWLQVQVQSALNEE